MYCKFCGSKIEPSVVSCPKCGAKIDVHDGGQSFFEDGELSAWKSDNICFENVTSVPRTGIIEQAPMQAGTTNLVSANYSPRRMTNKNRKKKRSFVARFFDFLNLSNSNRLIAVFIFSAVTIVLLIVGIIAVVNSGKGIEENVLEATPMAQQDLLQQDYNNQTDDISQEVENNQMESAAVDESFGTPVNVTIIDENGNNVEHPIPSYNKEGKLFISIDRVLTHEGYNVGQASETDKNHIIYKHSVNDSVIEIQKWTNKIWISTSGGNSEVQTLDEASYNVGTDTYIPIRSFWNLYKGSDVEMKGDILYLK